MGSRWKPVFIIAWCGAGLYILLGAALGSFFDPQTASAGLRFAHDPDTGRVVIKDLEPGGAAQRSGLQVGDMLDGGSTQALVLALREPPKAVPLLVDRSGAPVSLVLDLDEVAKDTVHYVFEIYGLVLMAPLCLVAAAALGLGRTDNPSFRWLAVMFVAWSLGWASIVTNVYWYGVSLLLQATSIVVAPLAMTRFWLDFSAEQGVLIGKSWTPVYRALQLLGMGLILSTVLDTALLVTLSNDEASSVVRTVHKHLFGAERSQFLWIVSGLLLFGTCTILPIVVIRRSEGTTSNTAFWTSASLLGFFIAPAGFFVAKALAAVSGVDEATWESFDEIWTYATMPFAVLSILAFMRLALKRRMMSFAFAVNATGVYLVTGAVLVGAFWLLKKNIEVLGFVHEETQSAMLSATIAGLAFVAKQLQGAADKTLKRFIFVNFNRRESRLAAFKAQMGHHKTLAALDAGAMQALREFCHGAEADVYRWNGNEYVCGSGDRSFPADHELPLSLRTRRSAVGADGLTDANGNSVRLAAPAFHRFEMVFFVVVQESPALPVFRPDEIALIEDLLARWAVERSLLELDGWKAKFAA